MRDKLELDKYDVGIIINALNSFRNEQIKLQKSEATISAINELLLKLLNIYEKNKIVKCLRKDEI